jgi:hypothetical protein
MKMQSLQRSQVDVAKGIRNQWMINDVKILITYISGFPV